MNRRMEVPIVVVILSAAMNVIFVLGLVVSLFTGSGALSLVRSTLTPTATATATATATVTPTKTSTPTASPTRPPTATPVPCGQDEAPGVDCAIDVGGLAVIVTSQERSQTFVDGNGQEWPPKNDTEEFLVVHLTLPPWTIMDDLAVWFEDGLAHPPMVIDSAGNIYRVSHAWGYELEGGFDAELVFEVPKNAGTLTLIIQPGVEVDLSLVPDLTIVETVVDSPNPAAVETSEAP